MRDIIGILDGVTDQPPAGPITFAFDPGVSTGWAIYDSGRNRLTAGQAGGETVLDQYDYYLDRAGHALADAVVVIESFIIPAQPKVRNVDMTYPIEMIGALKYVTRTHGITTIKMQQPSFRKIASAKIMEKFGWPAFTGRDQLSAAQHLCSHLLQKNAVPTFENVVG